MGLDYANLDPATRQLMVEELRLDVRMDRLYRSERLNQIGKLTFASLLEEALERYDDDWLAGELVARRLMVASEWRRTRHGGHAYHRLPADAPETLAEGEFNRFYVRGVCARAIAEGSEEVIVYRAKPVAQPRPESEALIGKRVNARKLLDDLRASQGVDPALGVPAGPNSGISVRLG